MSFPGTLDAPEDQGLGATQMHDAAIDAGLVARPERVITVDEFNSAYRDELEAHVSKVKSERTVKELEDDMEFDDGGEDDDALIAQLREKRMQELRQAKAQKLQASNELREISPLDFEEQVKTPSKQGYVCLLVYKQNHSDSLLLQTLLRSFAAKHTDILCIQMHVSQHIANLPPQDCPVLLIYHQTRVLKQFVGLSSFCGKETNEQVLEWVLADVGVCETKLEEDPRVRIEKARKLDMKRKQEEEESDSDDD